MDYQHLSTLLWREQELLDLLLFKAEEKQYLILTGKTRWLARIAHEIEVVLDQLRTLEVERAAATEAIAVKLGLGSNPSLRQVADAAPVAVERPLRQAPRGAARPRHRPAQPVRRQPGADRGRPGRHRRRPPVGEDPLGRHVRLDRPRRRRLAPRRHPGRGPVEMSTFSSLNAATTALWAQRRALDVTGQNIANVNTEGYSRQRVDLQALGGSVVPAFFSTSTGIGGGVSADEVTRIRDAFLEGRGHTEHANSARLTVENDDLRAGRAGLPRARRHRHPEPAVGHVVRLGGRRQPAAGRAGPWAGPQAPGDPGRRHPLQPGLARRAVDQSREALDVLVADVNASAASIADLNKAIQRANQSGLTANDLSDQRDVLVMKLADQVGAIVRHGDDGVVDVLVGGMTPGLRIHGGRLRDFGTYSVDGVTADPPRIVTASSGYTVRAGREAEGQLTR